MRIIWCLLTLIVLAGGITYWVLLDEPPGLVDDPEAIMPANIPNGDPKEEAPEESCRRKLLGVWQDEYQGKRTMTLNKDGTGTMFVELSGMNAVFGSKLRFDMTWSLTGNKLSMITSGGEPADQVRFILSFAGNTGADTILELTDDRLLLKDKNGKTQYDWRRVRK